MKSRARELVRLFKGRGYYDAKTLPIYVVITRPFLKTFLNFSF